MRILYGTTNSAKLSAMRQALDGLGLELVGLKELGQPIPPVDESGRDPLENAQLKARVYYEAFQMPVFSCDTGLYFQELSDEEQPKTHVRRVNGRELNDEEMTEYYAGLARRFGGRMTGYYQNAICLILDQDHIYRSMDPSLYTEAFWLVDRPHGRRVPGFPMDCLSVNIRTGRYYYDELEKEELSDSTFPGFRAFFEKIINERHL